MPIHRKNYHDKWSPEDIDQWLKEYTKRESKADKPEGAPEGAPSMPKIPKRGA